MLISITAIIASIVGGLSALISAYFSGFLSLQKEKNSYNIAANEQAFKLYKSLVESLSKDIEMMKISYDKIENNYILCREENARLKENIKFLENKILEFKK
ncbi:MAG: hypothetical protein SNJ64_01855 [Endomicrobiia bacterium]